MSMLITGDWKAPAKSEIIFLLSWFRKGTPKLVLQIKPSCCSLPCLLPLPTAGGWRELVVQKLKIMCWDRNYLLETTTKQSATIPRKKVYKREMWFLIHMQKKSSPLSLQQQTMPDSSPSWPATLFSRGDRTPFLRSESPLPSAPHSSER